MINSGLPNIIILGPPCAGKGTLARKLATKFGYVDISMGNLIKDYISDDEQLKKSVYSGNCIGAEMAYKILKEKLLGIKHKFIVDGFPRTESQVEYVSKIKQLENAKVIVLTIEEEESLSRGTNRLVCKKCKEVYNEISAAPTEKNKCDHCGSPLLRREDDCEDVILKRLRDHKEEENKIIEKLVNIYGKNNIKIVNGNSSFKNVFNEVTRIVVEEN